MIIKLYKKIFYYSLKNIYYNKNKLLIFFSKAKNQLGQIFNFY